MPQTLEQTVDSALAEALPKHNPRLAAVIDRLIAQGVDEDVLTEAVRSMVKRQTMRPSEASMTYAAIVAYIQRAFAARAANETAP